ncbi:ATP-binding cassette, subfamily B (MDR/TAP), member 1, partial [Phenoliferia sp. Uapishka_3]
MLSPPSTPPQRSSDVPLTLITPTRSSSLPGSPSRSPRMLQSENTSPQSRSSPRLLSPAMIHTASRGERSSSPSPIRINISRSPTPSHHSHSRNDSGRFDTVVPFDLGLDDDIDYEDEEDDDEFVEEKSEVIVAKRLSFLPPPLVFAPQDAIVPTLPFSPTESDPTPSPFNADSPSAPPPKRSAHEPSLKLLFSLTPIRSQLLILVPAVVCTVISALIPPYMTELLGTSFASFTTYTIATASTSDPETLKAAKATLMKSARLISIEFTGLAVATILLTCIGLSLWIVIGERVARDLRLEVFKGVGKRDMEWFDLGMGAEEATEEEIEEGESAGEGAGGLMGRFSKETDEVRIACSQTMGLTLQYLISFLACLVLSFYRGYKLTFVILSSVPVMLLIVAVTGKLSENLGMQDKTLSAKSSARVDRVLNAMPTVKAFNAEEKELAGLTVITMKAKAVYTKLHFIWGIRLGLTQFMILGMFVQGFWFGAYLVRSGQSTPAAVNTCFWACVLATSFITLVVPNLVIIERGKMSMANLLDISRAPPPESAVTTVRATSPAPLSPTLEQHAPKKSKFSFRRSGKDRRESTASSVEPFATNAAAPGVASSYNIDAPLKSPTFGRTPTLTLIPLAAASGRRTRAAPRALRKLRPTTFSGELGLKNVSFHYPSRPHPAPPALLNVDIYLAPCETTFIVGGSGSGKSTVAQLLLGLYRPELGSIEVDEQGLEWIEEDWLRGHVACVSQGASVMFDGSVHDNVAIGVVGQIRSDGTMRDSKDVTREEVVEACRGALIHDFVRDLPEGYDTWLSGERGASLSGGQRQRLAIARAWIRNPTVLILDEATSALDATSRLLVSEALRQYRRNKTTIIITHDLTPINPDDFVYVMQEGQVVEQGYRTELEGNIGGPFYLMANSQGAVGADTDTIEEIDSYYGSDSDYEMPPSGPTVRFAAPFGGPDISVFATPPSGNTPRTSLTPTSGTPTSVKRSSYRESSLLAPSAAFGIWSSPGNDLAQASRDLLGARRASTNFMAPRKSISAIAYPPMPKMPKRWSEEEIAPPIYDQSKFAEINARRRGSAMSIGADYSRFSQANAERRGSNMSFAGLEKAANRATSRRTKATGNRIKHATMVDSDGVFKEWKNGADSVTIQVGSRVPVQMSLKDLVKRYYPTIPHKSLFWFSLVLSVGVGACTPIFSSLLAKLMTNIGNPDGNPIVLKTSLLILLIAFCEGLGTGLKFYLLERCAMEWIVALRLRAFSLVSKQDKEWHDRPENNVGKLTNMLIKDTEDARALVGTIATELVVVIAMIGIGLVWAFIVGWELTLVGIGLAPVFVIATRLQANVQSKFEGENKIMRENVSTKFHQNVSNIRAIRSMAIEKVFATTFEEAVQETYVGGRKAATFSAFGYALGNSLTYIAEALMFYVGAVLCTSGKYTFSKMIEVFTLILFSITFSSQIMAYLPGMAKAIRASIDLARLLDLSVETKEAEGRMTFPIAGQIVFDKVQFAYPQRSEVPILKGMSFEVKPGECVGIVGASGSGKSTVTALLQRLYEPDGGAILLDGRPLDRIDAHYLRDHIAIVSQHPALFDMTIHDNIAYGNEKVSEEDVIRAAQAAHVHDFISGLPKGYQTMLGENASLISGGQAQRLQIARALVRHREILILDECTSALDPVNQAAVMETILSVKQGKTTIIVTHKLDVMKECDRLLVLDAGGIVAESGTFAELRARTGGLFATLASAGEWEHQ